MEATGAVSPATRRYGPRLLVVLAILAPVLAVTHEARTSQVQAALFSRIAPRLDFELGTGVSDEARFPTGGPYDERLGYPRIPTRVSRLDSLGFEITHQARLSSYHAKWVDRGLHPIYRTKGVAGLRVSDRTGRSIVEQRHPAHAYADFDSVPELLWRTLLHIESQGLLEGETLSRNPAIEWDRLAYSAVHLALRRLGAERSVPGGSTLATQLEKYRHSPGGMTRSPADKLRQMLSASARAYMNGPETYEERRRIVTDFLNSVPLAGRAGHGEVLGIADGLRVWYGRSFVAANQALRASPVDSSGRMETARAYRQVLSLLVAQRRPTYYLARAEGNVALAELTDAYLRLLDRDNVIPTWLATASQQLGPAEILASAPGSPDPPASKTATQMRSHLLGLIGAKDVYALDRLDLSVGSSLDLAWDSIANGLLASLGTWEFLRSEGFLQPGLLDVGDPTGVLYSLLVLERTAQGNAIRIQADNFDGPLSLADGSRLELGSTAKLRTLVTYLEIVEEIHRRLIVLDRTALRSSAEPPNDILTRWVAEQLLAQPDAPLAEVLGAALDRRHSASPRERFVTGGSELTFSNFDHRFDDRALTVREAFRHSVNLPFIRLMRELVGHEVGQLGSARLVANDSTPMRVEYLRKFAEHEGAQFVRRFHRKYRSRSGPEVLAALLEESRLGMAQVAWAVRAVAPGAPIEFFGDHIRRFAPPPGPSDVQLADLYERTDPRGLVLSDLGYLARVHPLELWVASYQLHNPDAGLEEVLAASSEARLEVYGWLLRTSRRHAQDIRISSMLEIEAFQRILARWRRLGYPFESIVPSLGTAIGSSGDRPLALAELAGTILNGGVHLPVIRVESVRFGEETPFETRMALRPAVGQQLLSPEVASAIRELLVDVVESGTGRRARGAFARSDGSTLEIGGKTGTGDNRFRVYDGRGRLRDSRVVSRTAAFVFTAGDRFFGVATAFVPGPEAGAYGFTSALPVQVLRVLGHRLDIGQGPEGIDGASARPNP